MSKKQRNFYLTEETMKDIAYIQEYMKKRTKEQLGYERTFSQAEAIEMSVIFFVDHLREREGR